MIIIILLFLIFIYFFQKNKNIVDDISKKLYNGKKWNKYRIGDVYRFGAEYTDKNGNLKYHLVDFPNSIASEYIKLNKPFKKKNLKLIKSIINKRINKKINNNELILHIRTGDVMCIDEQNKYRYSRFSDTIWWHNLVSYIINNNITKIYILSGSHYEVCSNESAKYLEDSKQFLLKKTGVDIEYRLGQSPDDDILFCAGAKHFITTGGGYGELIKELLF